ncbi:MAG: ATP-binding cassette domain-containing protein, partial [Chloroflexi bacterium]|nr:ATP-binding cassette domain-containing protein [Chloroflexota bacterium]
MAQETLLKVSNIDVFHGSFQALWDVSLVVKRGEIVALIGANASGKSTLLNILGGIDSPTQGKVFFEGEDLYIQGDLALSRIRNERIGFVF